MNRLEAERKGASKSLSGHRPVGAAPARPSLSSSCLETSKSNADMTLAKKALFTKAIRNLAPVLTRLSLAPEVLVGTALDRWCVKAHPHLPKSALPRSRQLASEPELQSFVDLLLEQTFLEASYWLSSAYAMLSEEKHRKQAAMYFTPPSLTQRLLDDLEAQGVDFAERSFCDPACGGAAFLAPIAQRMRQALIAKGRSPKEILKHVSLHIFGCDQDAALCKLSAHFLLMVLQDEASRVSELPVFRIGTADSLKDLENLFGTLDVLVCNPPFRKMPSDEVDKYRAVFGEVIGAQPNIYGLFIALCVKLLAPSGVCALVTPTSFLSGQYFSRLRCFLMRETAVLSIGMVSDREGVFMDVLQETALTLLRKEAQVDTASANARVSVVARDGTYVDVGRCHLPNSGATWPIPRAEADVKLLTAAGASAARLSDYGYAVRIGTYVWNRDQRTAYISEAMARARCKSGAAFPLLWSSDIKTDGRLHFDGLKKSNAEGCFVNMETREHPSIVRRPAVLLQRVTSNDQPRRLVAAAVPASLLEKYGGFVGENHTVVLEQTGLEPALTTEELADLLGTPEVERYFRCISGATNVSAFELSQLALPDPVELKKRLADGLPMPDAVRAVVYGS